MASETQNTSRARRALDKGLWRFVKGGTELLLTYLGIAIDWSWSHFVGLFRTILPTFKRFTYRGRSYPYFYRTYNVTWKNERAIEIPIIKAELDKHDPDTVLEFGNVWHRYFKHSHDVIDKYETWPGVDNSDIIDFKPTKRYDYVFSVSTLEHVGWDEDEWDPKKTLVAIRRLQAALSARGTLVLTVPMGYNPFLDYLLDQDEVPFRKRYTMKRVSRWNDWEPAEWNEIRRAQYGKPYPSANGLLVLEFGPKR